MATSKEVTIVAIAGPTCTGKSSMSAEIARRFGPDSTWYSFDEYDLYPSGSRAMDKELAEPTITNWEDPALFDQARYVADLAQLKRGEPVTITAGSRESLVAGKRDITVEPAGLVIVEGLFTLHRRAARTILDFSCYVDLPEDVMVARRLSSDRGGEGPWDDEEYIRHAMVEGTIKYVLPQKRLADVQVNGLLPQDKVTDDVHAHIKQFLDAKS